MRYPDRLTILHKNDGEPYRRWCSIRGLRRAHKWGATAIDIDVNITRDGVVVATHWQRPMLKDGFSDPAGKLGRFKRVATLTMGQVSRLRAYDGYRIWRTRRMMREAARLGITLCLEAKPDGRFAWPQVWQRVAADAAATGASVIVMSQPHQGHGFVFLEAASMAGLPTMLLSRGVPRAHHWRVLDYVKGPREWTKHAPADVRVVGGHPGIATRWGCSVHATREDVRRGNQAVHVAWARGRDR